MRCRRLRRRLEELRRRLRLEERRLRRLEERRRRAFDVLHLVVIMAMAQFSPMAPHVFQIRRAVMEFQEVAKWSIVVVCVVEMEQRHPMDHLVLAIV